MRFLLVSTCGPLETFRLPELDSIAVLYGFKISYALPEYRDPTRPYILIDVVSEREARLIGERSISVKSIWEWWGDAKDYTELHAALQPQTHRWESFQKSTPWKFTVASFARTLSLPEQVKVIDDFAYFGLKGPIAMKTPVLEVGVFEEYKLASLQAKGKRLETDGDARSASLRWVFVGRKVCDTQRSMVDRFDLKRRSYIGTTSMEAEVSLLMANQALAQEGKLIYDPFAGTGSMLLTCSAFGALTFGSDIDGRQLRGRKGENTPSIASNAVQYGLVNKILDCAIFDLTQHPFRCGEIFDSIITDPPYGVRAGAKRLGRKDPSTEATTPTLIRGRESEGPVHQMLDYVPPQQAWEMTEVITSLCTFALYLLRPSGRLVFFLPTDNEDYADVDIPDLPGLTLISNTLQDYGKWGRRLITMEKDARSLEVGAGDGAVAGWDRGIDRMALGVEAVKPDGAARREGHRDFRERYMCAFRPLDGSSTSAE